MEDMLWFQPSLKAVACHSCLDIRALVFFHIKREVEMGNTGWVGRVETGV